MNSFLTIQIPCAWIVSGVSQRIYIFKLVKHVFVDTLYFFVAIKHLWFQSLSIVSCLTRITVCSTSFNLLLLETDILELRAAHSFEFLVTRRRITQFTCRPRFECGITFPHCEWHRNTGWVYGCSQALVAPLNCVFFSFSWRRWSWGCECNLETILFFSLWPVLLVLIIIIFVLVWGISCWPTPLASRAPGVFGGHALG